MFQDQLTMYLAHGGRNYLNMSTFRGLESLFTWQVSSWIRWYARFIEQWIQTLVIVGDCLEAKIGLNMLGDGTNNCGFHHYKLKLMINEQLISEIFSLYELVEEFGLCGWESSEMKMILAHPLVKESIRLIGLVTLKAYQELRLRFKEIRVRIKTLCQSQAIDLLKVCEKLYKDTLMFTSFLGMCEKNHIVLGVMEELEVFNDYELMNLSNELKHASRTLTVSMVSTKVGYFFNGFKCPPLSSTQSMRYTKPNVVNNIRELRRRGSMSDFHYRETLI